jgi:bifunctional non-homologous end joining protein LigD
MMVRRGPAGVRLLTRNGYDWTGRFPRIAAAAEALRARSFLIDGEAVACDGDGLPVFDRLRYRRQDGRVFLYPFDLLELNGRDMRREPLEVRKSALAGVLRGMKAWAGIQLNEHCDDLPVDVVFRHACKLGFEGIVSKRVGSPYRSGRSRKTFHALFGRIGARAKMPFPIHPHMLRHGCGYALANAGHDSRALQAWLGHKNIQHTVRYTELAPDRFKNLARLGSRSP